MNTGTDTLKSDILIVMCNGPSLREQNFELIKQYDSLGLNAAYRYYYQTGFWPKYFACFDRLVCENHMMEFDKLIKTSPIERFFFVNQELFNEESRKNDKFQQLNFKRIIPFEKITGISKSFDYFVDMGCTGANATQAGIMMGYKKIILLGCDANYVPVVDGAEAYNPQAPHQLMMKYTPEENPNYWFDGYQREGDKFNLPKPEVFHIPAWERLAKLCPKDVKIVNCSNISQVKCFPIMTLEEAIKTI